LAYNCLEQPFLSVSMSVPQHDKFPNMDIGLVDPAGRTAGIEHHDHSIPHSQYGRVIEIPSHPELSKAVAVEICNPHLGAYLISVSESGDQHYRLSVRASDGSGAMLAEPVNLRADGDRICHYRFKLEMQTKHVVIRWLDKNGESLSFGERPTCDAVPRT